MLTSAECEESMSSSMAAALTACAQGEGLHASFMVQDEEWEPELTPAVAAQIEVYEALAVAGLKVGRRPRPRPCSSSS